YKSAISHSNIAAGTPTDAEIWYILNSQGGCKPTLTINVANGSTICASAAVISEWPAALAVDKTSSAGVGAAASPLSSGTTAMTSATNEFMSALVAQNSATLSSGPTNSFFEYGDDPSPIFNAWNQVTSVGSYGTAWTPSSNSVYAGVIATFKLPAAPGPAVAAIPRAIPTPSRGESGEDTTEGAAGSIAIGGGGSAPELNELAIVSIGVLDPPAGFSITPPSTLNPWNLIDME